MAPVLPITRQIARAGHQESRRDPHDLCISDVSDCVIFDRHGVCKTFNSLFQHDKAIIIFVRVRNPVYVGRVQNHVILIQRGRTFSRLFSLYYVM